MKKNHKHLLQSDLTQLVGRRPMRVSRRAPRRFFSRNRNVFIASRERVSPEPLTYLLTYLLGDGVRVRRQLCAIAIDLRRRFSHPDNSMSGCPLALISLWWCVLSIPRAKDEEDVLASEAALFGLHRLVPFGYSGTSSDHRKVCVIEFFSKSPIFARRPNVIINITCAHLF